MRYFIALGLWLNICVGTPAFAEEWQTLDFARRYGMFWGGVRVGYIAAEIRQNKKGLYRFEVRIKSKGLLEWVSKYQSTSVTTFRFDKGNLIPVLFESSGSLRGKHSSTIMEYDAKGNVTQAEIQPPKRPWKHKDVPAGLLVAAQNPLTGAVASREFIKGFIEREYEQGKFNISIYDGKRLGDYHFTVLGSSVVSVKEINIPVYGMKVARKAIAGFSEGEVQKMKEEPVVSVYFPKNQALLPIKAEAKVPYGGNAVILYDRDCATIEDCAVER